MISVVEPRRLSACAVATRSHLAHAKVLAASFFAHHPDGRLYLLVIDGLPAGETLDPRVRLIAPEELATPWFWELCVRYEPLALSCALKPTVALTTIERYRESAVVYLDGDLLLARPLEEATRLLESADVVLTPHVLEPIEPDGCQPDELYILTGGVYNMGFFGVRGSEEGRRFLRWWAERNRLGCRDAPTLGMYLDQRWIDLAPALFTNVAILRDATYNVAYWNLSSREIVLDGDRFLVNGEPLTFFHFSGIDLAAERFHPSYQSRFEIAPGTALHALVRRYAELLRAEGWTGHGGRYELAFFDNGVPFHALFKALYLKLPEARRAAFGNPFASGRSGSFFEWALTPDPAVAHLSPFLSALYESDPEIPRRFPDVGGARRTAFVRWAMSDAARKLGYDPALVRADPELAFASQLPPVEADGG